MKNLLRVLLVGLCLGTVWPRSVLAGDPQPVSGAAVPTLADDVTGMGARRLIPEPGIFILIATAGFLLIIRRRG